MAKCYMKNCINNNEWACAYREDCDYCSKDCKHYYKCIDCDYYMDESIEEEFMEDTNKNKFKMELTWHNCKTYPPKEYENNNLVITDGDDVCSVSWNRYSGFYISYGNEDIVLSSDFYEYWWWADLKQTVRKVSEFKELIK